MRPRQPDVQLLLRGRGERLAHPTFHFLRPSKGDMAVRQTDLLQGTLDLLVLKSLKAGPNHGYGMTTRIQQFSDDVLKIEEGSLYPALYRMEEQGLIESEWGTTENNRRAKFYKLTGRGRTVAQAELDSWLRLSKAVTRVLRAVEQEG